MEDRYCGCTIKIDVNFMTETIPSIEDKSLEILLHVTDNPINADIFCPHSTWMGDDLVHCSGVGESRCALQQYKDFTDQYGGFNVEYHACKEPKHTKCTYYHNQTKK